MEFTNECLEKMEIRKKEYNTKYSKWYYGMSQEDALLTKRYSFRSDKINDCLNVWHWDKYEKNKLLDLRSVNRCRNNRFCPNCKLLDISKFIHEFRKYYDDLSSKGYRAYMLTLTVPSVPGDELRGTIDKLNKSFRKLIEKFSYDIDTGKAYSDRLFQIDGGIKVLEITYNDNNGFHPHFHCVVFSKDILSEKILDKFIQGKWSNKRNSYNYKSHIDIQLSKLWSMIWYNEKLTIKNIDTIVYDPKEEYFKKDKKCLEVDFRELDEDGIYEVFKYTFKDTDIKNYYVFKTLVKALESKRIRQGFGILFNMQCEDVEIGEVQDLELEIKENPESLVTFEINNLITTYRNYRKISRFNRPIDNNIN